jgi:hypothetical protein
VVIAHHDKPLGVLRHGTYFLARNIRYNVMYDTKIAPRYEAHFNQNSSCSWLAVITPSQLTALAAMPEMLSWMFAFKVLI